MSWDSDPYNGGGLPTILWQKPDHEGPTGGENFSPSGTMSPSTWGAQASGNGGGGQTLQNFMASSQGLYSDPNFLSKMPTWDLSDPNAENDIKEYTKAAGAGIDLSGYNAFTRGGGGPMWQVGTGGETDNQGYWDDTDMRRMLNWGSQMGIDTSQIFGGASGAYADGMKLYDQLNDKLKDFRLITGLDRNQTPGGRMSNEVLYQNIDNKLVPLAGRQKEVAEKHGWLKSESGGSFLQAMMMMAPAAGGVMGAAGTAAGEAGAAAGAAGGASGSLAGQAANYLGLGSQWAGLPAWGQSAISGGLQGLGSSALTGGNPLTGAFAGAVGGALQPSISGAVKDLGLGQVAGSALGGAASGGLGAALSGNNPLTGALMGGIKGGAAGGAGSLGASGGVSSWLGNMAGQVGSSVLQNQIKNEVFQGRQDIMNGLYQEAQSRGISREQLEQFMMTPQGRQAAQSLMSQQGKGTLQSLFG